MSPPGQLRLQVEPVDSLVDRPPAFIVHGAAEGSLVTLTIDTVDADGKPWRSVGEYQVGPGGLLMLDDPDQPWSQMEFADPSAVPVVWRAPDDASTCEVSVSGADGHARMTVKRVWRTGAAPVECSGPGWRLRIYRPRHDGSGAAIMLVPGTTGPGTPYAIAALLASHGYIAAVLSYMGEPGLAPSFRELDPQVFRDGLRALGDTDGVDRSRLAVYGISVGTIPAAYAFSQPEAPELRALILVASSSVVWQALADGGPPPAVSCLAADSPWLPIKSGKVLGQIIRNALAGRLSRRPRSKALVLRSSYEAGLADTAKAEAAAIPVERIACPVMTISGGLDAMWPASRMAAAIHQRRSAHGRADGDLALDFPQAGHFFRPPATPTTVDRNESLVAGGTASGTAAAQRESWTQTLRFLEQNLG